MDGAAALKVTIEDDLQCRIEYKMGILTNSCQLGPYLIILHIT